MNCITALNYAEKINNKLNGIVWGFPLIVLILLTGVVVSVGTGFFQIRCARLWVRETVGSLFAKKNSSRGAKCDGRQISQFQAACTALAATIGTGNIAGVATAIALGGPGAVFWMWVSAFFGMMTAYCENVLGIYYRRKNQKGEWCGGPMYYIGNGIKAGRLGKILSVLFALFCICASFGIGNMTQINSISSALSSNFGTNKLTCGICVSVAVGFVVVGGVKRLGKVTEMLVPVMSLLYIGACITVVLTNFRSIPYVFKSIISGAFSFASVAGAGSGLVIKRAVSCGIRRGIFSNEAGLGSSVIVNSASNATSPVQQGMWGIFEVFFDTLVVCSMTAFVLLSSCCEPVSLEQALNEITCDTQIVSINDLNQYSGCDNIPLVDESADPVIKLSSPSDKSSQAYTVRTKEGEEFKIFCKRGNPCDSIDNIHTNVMSIRGVCVDPSSGKVLRDGKINAVIFEKIDGIELVTCAFSSRFGIWSGKLLAIAILFFAFSTLLGWSYYGVKSWEYLFGEKTIALYKALFVAFIVPGAIFSMDFAWGISDTLNGLMAIPNLIGVLTLSGKAIEITNEHLKRKMR